MTTEAGELDNQVKTSPKLTKAHKIERARKLLELSVRQRNAIDLIVMGASDQDAADKVGVARETVTRWRLYHPAFRAELDRSRRAVWCGSADRLRALIRKSMDILEEVLDDPDDPKRSAVALSLVRDSGIFPQLPYIGTGKLADAIEEAEKEIGMDKYITPRDAVDPDSLRYDDLQSIMERFDGEDDQ
jgi:hypothetical protein